MLIIKSKKQLFPQWKQVEHDGWLYQFLNEDYKVIAQHVYHIESHQDIKTIQFDKDAFILIGAFTPLDIIKTKNLKGKPIKLADGNDWYFRTIADVNYKFVLSFDNGEATERLEACDPLFDFLLQKADELKQGGDLSKQIDIAVEVLASQYYITRNMALAMGLFTTDNLEQIIKAIYLVEEVRDEQFFREVATANETGEPNS